MTITNHALTGALVAVFIGKPIVALPAALLSHFVIDIIPHWDYKFSANHLRNVAVMVDFTLSLLLLLILSVTVHASHSLIIAGGVLAILPDLMWARYRNVDFPSSFPKNTFIGRLRGLHQKIQWNETSRGIYVEAAWLVAVLFLIYQLGN